MNKKNKMLIILMILVLLITSFLFVRYTGSIETFCGVKVIAEDELRSKYNVTSETLSGEILMDGYPAPYYVNNKQYIIPETIEEDAWMARLSCSPGYKCFIVKDDYFKLKEKAIQENHEFQLYICDSQNYAELRTIIFTSLPVLVMSHQGELRFDTNVIGEVSLFDPKYRSSGGYCNIDSSYAEWHIRGNSSASYEKKSYKLSLKDKRWQKENHKFLDMRNDDDWVLNAIYQDGQNVKEKLVFALWEEIREYEGSKWKFADGNYVELIVDGDYVGLYSLNTRIDSKLESLKDSDAIFQLRSYITVDKTMWLSVNENTQSVGCILMKDSLGNDQLELWNKVRLFSEQFLQDDEEFSIEKSLELIDIENQIDNNLLSNYLQLVDNIHPNNVCYVYDSGNEKFVRLMWDFDAGFIDNEGTIIETFEIRKILEHDSSSIIWSVLCERWKELSKNILNYEHVSSLITDMYKEMEESGVWVRESIRWPNEALDTEGEWLYSYLKDRNKFLDEYYQ